MAQATRDPHVILIGIYIFAPYFVTRFVGDPVAGQTLVAEANKWGGWIVVATAPLLGATIDRLGPRKPWLGAVIALLTGLTALLWFTPPDGSGLSIPQVVAIFTCFSVLIAFHDMLHNALLLPAAGVKGAAHASGLALAGGNFVSVFMLIGVLIAFALPGKLPWPWLPAAPLFGLDPALGEPDRVVTLIVAAAMSVGAIPLFLVVPDVRASGRSFVAALRAGAGDLRQLVAESRGNGNALVYLGARMIYTDGLTSILIFGGLFAAGTMRWGTLEMLGYGIVLSIAAVAGGLLAAVADTRLGPRRALIAEISLIAVAETLFLGMDRTHIVFLAASPAPVWASPLFASLPELAFLGLGCFLAIGVTAAYASSRTMLTRVAPPDKLGVFFGLYALSGTATLWLGPLLVEYATRTGGSQAWGLAPIVGMLVVGLAGLFFVRGGGRLV
ncbi:MFS transporter [alpha proteobacterium AAP81b]|nr:MFS transporter [alpha proteobacterium AAP81b]